jgi:N6-adenosine-specific RNA methylase IME4
MFIDIYNTDKKYQLIYADPPWKQSRGGAKSVRPNSSGINIPYQVLSLEEIHQILSKTKSICDENHILFMWTIDKYLHDSELIATNLGYKLHARMIWNKVTGIPAAFTVRFGHEYLLYCYYGKLLPVALEQRGKWHTVMTEQVKEHSRKPDIAYRMIESLYPNLAKIELFARINRDGWDCWGNETTKFNTEYKNLELPL